MKIREGTFKFYTQTENLKNRLEIIITLGL